MVFDSQQEAHASTEKLAQIADMNFWKEKQDSSIPIENASKSNEMMLKNYLSSRFAITLYYYNIFFFYYYCFVARAHKHCRKLSDSSFGAYDISNPALALLRYGSFR